MRIVAGVSLSMLVLAGCHKDTVNETNASVEEVANAVAKAKPSVRLQPGRWETTGQLVALDAPGMPPQAQEMMKKQLAANASRVAVCLKQEDVDKPNAGLFGQTSKDCRFDHYRMDGGSIDAKMSCTPPSGGSMTMTMAGRYDSAHYDMDVSSTMSGVGARQPMTMKMKLTSQHVGDCQGNEVQATPKACRTRSHYTL